MPLHNEHGEATGSASDYDDFANQARQDFEDLSRRSRIEAQRVGRTIQAELGRVLQGQQEAAADVMRDVAMALRENRVASKNGREHFDRFEHTIADALERSATGVEQFDVRDVGQRIDRVVRDQPLAAAVGAAAVGLLISRFIKSSRG